MLKAATTAEEVAFASSPDRWPIWPQLPLTRTGKDGFKELGRLLNNSLNDDTVLPVVYLGSIYKALDYDNTITYTDLHAVFDDGWKID